VTDPNVLIGGSVYALTAIVPVRPGSERRLSERVRAWATPYSPFALLPTTHFARLVVLDRLAFEGPERLRPEVGQHYLLFSATFDGDDRDGYLEEMCRRLPEQVESVFGLCSGAPRPLAGNAVAFREWIAGQQVETKAFFAQDPKATVAEVRAARLLSEALRRFASRTQYAKPDVLKTEFEQRFGWR
jgi:hypothetical protein